MKKIVILVAVLCFLMGAGSVLALASEPPSSLPIWKNTFATEEGRKSFTDQLAKAQALTKDGKIIREKLDAFIFASAKEKGYDQYVGQSHRIDQEAYAKVFWAWNGMLSRGAIGSLPESISFSRLFAKHNRTGLYYPMHIGVYADLRRFKDQVSSLKGDTEKVKAAQSEVNAFVAVARQTLERGEFTQAMKDGLNLQMKKYFESALRDIANLKFEVKAAKDEREVMKKKTAEVATDVIHLQNEQETVRGNLQSLTEEVNGLKNIQQTLNSELAVHKKEVTETLEAQKNMKYIINFGVAAIVILLLLFIFSGHRLMNWVDSKFVSKDDLRELSQEVKEQGEDLEDLSAAFPVNVTFDTESVSKEKLEILSKGESILLRLSSQQSGSFTMMCLTVEKTGDNQVTIHGALRQKGETQPLVVDSLDKVSRAIKRAAVQNRINGIVPPAMAVGA